MLIIYFYPLMLIIYFYPSILFIVLCPNIHTLKCQVLSVGITQSSYFSPFYSFCFIFLSLVQLWPKEATCFNDWHRRVQCRFLPRQSSGTFCSSFFCCTKCKSHWPYEATQHWSSYNNLRRKTKNVSLNNPSLFPSIQQKTLQDLWHAIRVIQTMYITSKYT